MAKEDQANDVFDAMRVVVGALQDFSSQDQQLVLRFVQEKLGLIAQPRQVEPHSQSADALHTPASNSSPGTSADIKSFVEKKAPDSDVQFAATVAYYYQFEAPADQRKGSITVTDLLDACRKVNRNRPNAPAQTLINAHQRGLLDKTGDKGTYRLSTVGENLVAVALPSDGSSTQNSKKRKARKSAKKGSARKK